MESVEQLITDNLDIWSSAIKAKSAAGRGKNNKRELYGIKKLRELILELAVRGLLVPQSPKDEPASELLKKISAEKAKLLEEGRKKKQKPLPPIEDGEKLFELPSGWDWCRLGDVTEIVRGITFPASEKSKIPEKGRIACLRTTNVQDKIEWEDLLFIRNQFVKREDQFVQKNDLVMSMANSRELVGKVAIITDIPKLKTSFGGFLGVIRPLTLDAYFVMSLLRVPTYRDLLIGSASQTTNIANISLAKLNPMVFPIPPLAEQLRIVAKVDELMALCDQLEKQTESSISAHQTLVQTLLGALTNASEREGFDQAWARIAEHFDTLFTTEWSIDQLKQTILQLAVMGKLVPQNPNDEPASELLNKIAVEKDILIKEGKIKKIKKHSLSKEYNVSFQIPPSWEWVSFADIAFQITDGAHHTPTYVNEGVPFLSVKDMSKGVLDFSNTRYISEDQHKELIRRCFPKKGDLLLTKVGTTGIPILIDTDNKFSIFVSVALIKFPKDKILGSFLSLLVKSPLVKNQSDEGTEGIGNKNLVLRKIAAFKLVIPPLIEQQRIVEKVDKLMVLCDTLNTSIHNAQTTQLQLADAMAEQAVA